MRKYDLKAIMKRAWRLYKEKRNLRFAECLHRAWLSEKAKDVNKKRIEEAKVAAGIEEPVDTWAGWKRTGREVVHGMKKLFSVTLIHGSKGDNATYTASFFGESQTQPITT